MTSTSGLKWRHGLRALAAALLAAALIGQGALTANAKDLDEYATWDDVVAAQNDIDAQNALIDEINGQIEQLRADVADAEQVALEAGEVYAAASNETADQNSTVYNLQLQYEDAAQKAEDAEVEAGAMAAAMSNRVTVDPTVQLLTSPGDADDFLIGMSTLSKLGTHTGSVYEQAVSARNNAEQLGEQADVALQELERLEVQAQDAYDAAVTAQMDLQSKRDAAVDEGSELEAMLIPLQEHREVVAADYEEGERLREEERQRQEKARQEAAAAAAAAAEAARQEQQRQQQQNNNSGGGGGSSYTPPPASNNSGGGGGGGDGGAQRPSGYSYPMSSSAWITSPYGMRLHPIGGDWRMHNGIDLVVPGGTCWAPIYAVQSATVTLAGYVGSYGNLVSYRTDSGELVSNGHIAPGGINVWPGQRVQAGDVIGYAGNTGGSTGCHLHFEIQQNGSFVDPLAWLANRGMYY